MSSGGGEPAPDRRDDPHPTDDGDPRLLWFATKEEGFPIAPRTWQGRAATFLYCLLVLLAVVTYSQLALTAFVIGFYTVAFVLLVAYKSDLMEHWPPGR